jgi:transglutaminase-like putative cysteine protease
MNRLVLALSLLTATAARADVLFLNDGRELNGAVTRADAANIYLLSDGREIPYSRADVLKLNLVREWRLPGEDSPDKISDPTAREALKKDAQPEQYPDDGLLIALDDGICRIDADRRATCTWRKLSRILRERAKDRAANVRVSYLDGVDHAAIEYARAVTDGKVSYLDDTSVEDGSDFAQYPEYDRQKSIKFSIPNVSTSSWLDYRYRYEAAVGVSSHPFSAGSAFRSFEPTLLSRFTVVAPKGLELRWSEYKMPRDAVFTREDAGATTRYVWTMRNQPSFKEEDSMPPFSRIAPQVTVAPADTWERLAAETSSNIGPKREPGPALAAKAAELLKGLDTDERRAEALYNWVVREIKYESVGMAQYSYLPKSPEEIAAAKAGNSLDKPFLLYVLLRAAGLKPQLVYIGSKDDTPFDRDLPTLSQFSAAVVRLELGGSERFLAPFDDALRWNAQPGWLQGQDGLVVDGPDLGLLVKIPQAPADDERMVYTMKFALGADGGISGDIDMVPRGWHQAEWRGYKDWKKEDVDKQFEKVAHSIHPNARLVSYAIDNLEDMTQDLRVRLSFKVKDYAITASGGYLAFRIPWVDRPAGDVGKPAREQPMYWSNRDRSILDAEIALPKGYELHYAPEPLSFDGAGCSYRASYQLRGATLNFHDEFTTGTTEIAPDDYPKYKSLREEAARFTQKWIVIRKKTSRP